MEEMGWSWQELMATPYEVYLDISRIISIEKRKEQEEQAQQEQKMKKQA